MNILSSNGKALKVRQTFSVFLVFLLFSSSVLPVFPQSRISGANSSVKKESARTKKEEKKLNKKSNRVSKEDAEITAEPIFVQSGGQRTMSEIMADQTLREGQKTNREMLQEKGIFKVESEVDRTDLRQNPLAPRVSRFPYPEKGDELLNVSSLAPQTIGLNFDTVTGPAETGAFPPDTMGAIGPTQFFVALNGRFRTFNKTTGAADGVVNVDSDVFFASVMTPPTASNFSTDPNVRYDRLSGRWFLNMIDVPNGTGATANRIMIAVSDGPTITGATVWTYYQFTGNATLFTDYQSFGVDAIALYIGANMFTLAGNFSRCDVWVIPKAPTLTASAITVYGFTGVVTGTGAGPFAPRGVDNVDPTNTGPTALGYFIGVDNATFSTLMIRRITNPGASGGPPTISANVPLTVPTTTSQIPVQHLGNTGGNNGRLDALDDRLYAAVLRNGRLWTAHNIRTLGTGVASTNVTNARNSIRWYEIQNVNATPSLFQSGTIYDTAVTLALARQYWIPSITVSGQGHAAVGASTAGTAFRADAFTTGRLVGDALGTMRNSPGSIPGYTTSTFAYNPPGDPGGAAGRRWGDYSFTSLDPLDDMTIWTIQEYNNGTNTYGTRVAQLLAPPPASIADGPDTGGVYNVSSGLSSVNVTINGTSVSGSGWYDPGTNLGGGAVPFNHLTATVSGSNVTVNSVTYNSPTSITLNLNTVGATIQQTLAPESLRDLTITNPDGQSVTRNAIINIQVLTAAPVGVSGRVITQSGRGIAGAVVTATDLEGNKHSTLTSAFGYFEVNNLTAGQTYVFNVSKKNHQFLPQVISVGEDIFDFNFVDQ